MSPQTRLTLQMRYTPRGAPSLCGLPDSPVPALRGHRLLRTAFVGLFLLALGLTTCPCARADGARFDLTGPKVDIRVTRAGMSLPIASVPNLATGDKLWVHPDLPATQSVRYLLVVVFLRGTTNPPPDNWFIRIETWDKKVREEGTEVTVPDGAQQAVMFLAPSTGGDFGALRSAVRGRPGIFVRASHDLDLAGFEQARIEKYVASMRQVPEAELSDAKALAAHSNLIAGTLALKPNGDCTKLPPDQQYTCLTQSGSATVLDDGQGQSIVAALSTGPGSDFINQASYTQLAGAGEYSAYVGAVVDLVRLMGSLHTAHYQYIPAIAFPDAEMLNLRLNTAPSFQNPKSVIVIGLPAIQPTSAPPLRPADPKQVSCLLKPGLTLPVRGAPLVFSTGFAHDLVLHINYPEDTPKTPALPQDLPLTADAYKGGLIVDTASGRHPLPIERVTLPRAPEPPASDEKSSNRVQSGKRTATREKTATPVGLTGTIEGFWGFDTFKGPTMALQNVPGRDWKLLPHDPLIAGKDQQVALSSTGTACVESIALETGAHAPEKATWKTGDKPNTLDVSLKLSAAPGNDPRTLQLAINQFGASKPDAVSLVSYSAPAKLNALVYHAGDRTAQLTGASLDQVKQVHLGTAEFVPQPGGDGDSAVDLRLAPGAVPPATSAGETLTAKVGLKDGRELPLKVKVEAPRPSVRLISKAGVATPQAPAGLPIVLGSQDDLPLSDTVIFALKSAQPFRRNARVEVASTDGSLHALLELENTSLILEDPRTVLAKLEPLKLFGPSAFGPVQVRAISPDGTTGDWIPLTTLVRLPVISSVSCPVSAAAEPDSAAPTPSVVEDQRGQEPQSAPAGKSSDALPGAGSAAPAPAQPTLAETAAAGTGSPNAAASGDVKTPSTPETSGVTSAPAVPGVAATPTGSAGTSASPGKPAAAATCTLSGSDLYLLDSISADPSFGRAVHVPEGFVSSTLDVPAPVNGLLYVRLRDDPAVNDTVSVPPPPPAPAPPEHSGRAERKSKR